MNSDQIKEVVDDLLKKLNVEAKAELREDRGLLKVDITGPDNKLLIGWKGQNLHALDHVIKVLLNKKADGPFKISIDVGGYKRSKDSYLIEVINKAIKFVMRSQKPFTLDAMDARSRRLVHVECSTYPELETESIGEGDSRRVRINYKGR